MAELERRKVLDQTPSQIPLSILNDNYQPPEPDVESDLGSVWEAATYRHWVGEALERNNESETVGGEDPEYTVDLQQLNEYNEAGYKPEELEFLAGSLSKENFAHREEQVQGDRRAVETISSAGVAGFGVEMAAAVFDPAMIPLMFINAPASMTAKAGTVGKLGWSMLRGAGEGVLSEYLLKQGDTQRTTNDLMLSAMGGMVFSGTIDLSVLGVKAGKNALNRANVIEAEQRAASRAMDNGAAYNRANESLSANEVDPTSRKRVLTERETIQTLRNEAGERADVLSPKKTKALKDEFRAYKKSKLELIENVKARPKLRPKARAAEIAQLETAIAKRQTALDDSINLNKAGLESNAKVDALQQGKIPESMMARYKELKAEKGEFDVTPHKRDKIVAGHKIKPTEEEPDPVLMQSVGAMRTRSEFDDINTHDDLLSESDVDATTTALSAADELGSTLPRNNSIGETPQGLRSLYTEIDGAPDQATRGLNAVLIKNPQKTTEGLQTAEELADTLFHRAAVDYLDFTTAFNSFADDAGIKWWQIGKRNKLEQEFDRETVMMQVSGNLLSNKPVDGDSAIMLGAKARSRLYEQGLKNNQDYNVVGFDKIKHRHEYHSIVFSQDNIRRMTGEHTDFMQDALASAYQTGAIKLSRENALSLAQTQIARTMAVKGKANKSFDSFMSEAEFKKIDEELSTQGIDRDVINDIKESLFNAEKMGEISPRAMFSLRPNMKARSGNVWLVDMLDTSINRNMKYVSDSSANAGLASNGFHSRHQYQRAVASARDASINELRRDVDLYKGSTVERDAYKAQSAAHDVRVNELTREAKLARGTSKSKEAEEALASALTEKPKKPSRWDSESKAGNQAEKALRDVTEGRYANKLDEALRMLYKEPLEDGDGLKDMTRLLRKATSVTRLRTTGLATLPEGATAGVRNGIINTMRQIPATRWFDFRETSVVKDKFMMDFGRTFSATGHQEYMFGKKFYNGSDFDDATTGALKGIDKKLGSALDITMTVNGFKTFQHGGEEMTARSIVNNLRDMSMKGEITPNIRKSLIDVGGMSESQVSRMVQHFNDNDMDIMDAVKLMDSDLHNSLSTAVRNTIGHSYLRMGIGEQPAYMNKEMGKIMTTLMSFTIGSYEKMLLRGIKNERAVLMSIVAGQAVLGYGALVANTYIQAQGMEGRRRTKYINEKLSDEGLFWGVMSRVGVFATPLVPLQMLNTVGLLPEEAKGVGRMGGVQAQAIVADTAKASAAAIKMATTKQSKRERDASYNAMKRVLPWYNSTLYNMTIGTATRD